MNALRFFLILSVLLLITCGGIPNLVLGATPGHLEYNIDEPRGALQYTNDDLTVGTTVSGCTCGPQCPCSQGGACLYPNSCPVASTLPRTPYNQQAYVAPYRAADGNTYRKVYGGWQVRRQTCNGNSCTPTWVPMTTTTQAQPRRLLRRR